MNFSKEVKDSYNENYKERKKDITEDTDQGKDTLQFTQLYYLKPVALPQNSPDHAVYRDLFLLERACSKLVLHCRISTGCNCFILGSTVNMFAPPAPTPPRQGRFLCSLCFSGSSSCCTYSSLRLLNAPTEGARGDQVGKAKSASRSYVKGNLLVRPTKQECKPRGCTTAWVRCCLQFFLTFKFSSFLQNNPFFFFFPLFCHTAWHMGS